jgi:glycosyltransferase involved in cell wall biosynthesis
MKRGERTKIMLFGKRPPPYIGPALATEMLLTSDLGKRYTIIHMDTSDPRGIETLGRFDVGNIYIAISQYFLAMLLFAKCRPDVVYILCAQTTIAYIRDIPFVLLARLFSAKIVFHLRGGYFRNWYESLGRTMRWIVGTIHPLIHAQIVLGENLRKMYDGILPQECIHVVPNGGNYEFSVHKINDLKECCVLYLGNFIPTKGILEFMSAARMIQQTHSSCTFVAAGGWQDAETKSEMLALSKVMESYFTIYENVSGDAKRELFEKADIFVFPTYYPYEGHPWVIVEAMAASLPIITTDHAAISESVKDGENGYLVEKRSPDAIACAITRLLDDEELRLSMGKRSRQRYESEFTLEHMVDRLSHVFEHVMKQTA